MSGLLTSCLLSCCSTWAWEAFRSLLGGISRESARIAYCGFFAFTLLLSWTLRDNAVPLLQNYIPWSTSYVGTECFEAESIVLRVSLASFLFFTIFAVLLIGVKDERDFRDSWHHGGWLEKSMAWFILLLLSTFFVSNEVIGFYEKLCKFGSALFLLIQVVLLLDFTQAWNDSWDSNDNLLWHLAMHLVSLVCYMATFAFSGMLFHWFSHFGHGCVFNTFLIAVTVIHAIVFAIAALHPSLNGSLLPASVISLYCIYLCYTGLLREPWDYIEYCNPSLIAGGDNDDGRASIYGSNGMMELVTTVLSLLYYAVSSGSNLILESERDHNVPVSEKTPFRHQDLARERFENEGRPVAYSYSLFHLLFAAASMHSAMLLTGWSTITDSASTIKLNDGWSSVWLRLCMEWIAAALYIWSLLAPLLLPDGDFLQCRLSPSSVFTSLCILTGFL